MAFQFGQCISSKKWSAKWVFWVSGMRVQRVSGVANAVHEEGDLDWLVRFVSLLRPTLASCKGVGMDVGARRCHECHSVKRTNRERSQSLGGDAV